jgi:hypothetical protein
MSGHSYPSDSKPHIKWNHVDGPLLICRDGTPHFLSAWERFLFRANFLTIEELDRRHNSEPRKG